MTTWREAALILGSFVYLAMVIAFSVDVLCDLAEWVWEKWAGPSRTGKGESHE